MSNFTIPTATTVATVRPCPFHQASLLATSISHDGSEGSAIAALHRCMLHAGKLGPDGKAITPDDCTADRQISCQSHRRLRFARLLAQPLPQASSAVAS